MFYRGAGKSLARPTSRCILFDGQNISFDASLVIDINSTNIPPIVIINRIYETQNLLSLQLVSFLVGLRTYQHPCILPHSQRIVAKLCLLTPPCLFAKNKSNDNTFLYQVDLLQSVAVSKSSLAYDNYNEHSVTQLGFLDPYAKLTDGPCPASEVHD